MRSVRLLAPMLWVLASCGDQSVIAIDAAPDSPTGIGTQCDDGIDNDGDGKIDFPIDPGCIAPQADDETDDCPDGTSCPQCSNGIDDDGNGSIDYPADPGCESAADNTEVVNNPVACGASLMIKNLPPTGSDTGTLDLTSTSMIATDCGGGGGAAAIAYRFSVAMPTVIVANTAGSAFDTVLDLRSADCDDPASEIACHNDISTTNKTSTITESLAVGNYYLIISGYDTTQLGTYNINVERFAGEGSSCTSTAACGPGLVCRTPVGGTANICTKPQCSDTLDDDADGKIDYPLDPGCETPEDNDETDPDPLPECGNGEDDDGDGQTDYPADTSCVAAGGNSEACSGEQDPIATITMGTINGSLAGAHNDHDPTCNTNNGEDVLYKLKLPAMRSLQLDTEGTVVDTVLTLLGATCAAPPLACDDDGGTAPRASRIARSNVAAGTYYVAIDNYSSTPSSDPYTLHVSGVIAPGGACNPEDTLGGALACPLSNPCGGTPGALICLPAICNDGMDNDADGKTDYPADPGCSSADDTDEADTCPGVGAGCPECSDGADNDGDGQTDYPADTSCNAPSGASEGCTSTDGVRPLVTASLTADTTADVNDVAPACGSSTNTAPDHTYMLELPALRSLTVKADTGFNWDAVTAMYGSTCGGTALACTDSSPETLNFTNLAAGNYFYVVDGYSSGKGQYTLTVSGVIQNGGSCESPLAQAGALKCNTGFACQGTAGARTCRLAACNDGLDNDGDGIADYPNDPGCSGRDDNDETDSCPGAGCPECADGADNDGDGYIDYPDEPSCPSAYGPSEACTTSEPVTPLVLAVTPDTTIGAINDDTAPACGSSTNTAGDKVYRLDVPALTSLKITNTNDFDAVVGLYNSTCGGTRLVCSDTPEDISINNLAAGTYYYKVDGYSSGVGTYMIGVEGVLPDGASCEHPLFAAGALRCSDTHACSGTAGSRTCTPAQCNDGLDNDSDGQIDFPFDPGCDTLADNDETNPTTATVCSNGMDDDTDTLTDFPADFGCSSAAGTTEVFCAAETDAPTVITMGTTMASTTTAMGSSNQFPSQTCQSNTTGNDRAFALQLPVPVTSLVLDLTGSGFDTVMSFRDASCGTQIACDDDGSGTRSKLTLGATRPGNYAIIVDGYNGASGAVTLSVRGTVAAGTSCASPLFASGVLACVTGTTCTGTTPTCQ